MTHAACQTHESLQPTALADGCWTLHVFGLLHRLGSLRPGVSACALVMPRRPILSYTDDVISNRQLDRYNILGGFRFV